MFQTAQLNFNKVEIKRFQSEMKFESFEEIIM